MVKKATTLQQYKNYYFSHVKPDVNDCHLWTASKNNVGYGMFRYDGKMRTVHRLMMEWEGYDIENKIVYHTCHNYHCVNPAHLRVGNLIDKTQMMLSKGNISGVLTDPKYFRTCNHCGYHGPQTVTSHWHNDKCKHKPVYAKSINTL
ncbi:hypothetical protein UFOVP623_11 [uncultured Caudovirales phage]|uniref:HNH nuclease n=1 Tax=uncultured Caudovirales phage TaxID=2100421 RepID=A0A6J5ND41_9CAUD|nr:hypothetical protein UFOVP623_11 [uncultured Caudovirales phage]